MTCPIGLGTFLIGMTVERPAHAIANQAFAQNEAKLRRCKLEVTAKAQISGPIEHAASKRACSMAVQKVNRSRQLSGLGVQASKLRSRAAGALAVGAQHEQIDVAGSRGGNEVQSTQMGQPMRHSETRGLMLMSISSLGAITCCS